MTKPSTTPASPALNTKTEDSLVKYESATQSGLWYWAQANDIDGGKSFGVVAQANGFPESEAHDDWFAHFKDADAVAKLLAQGKL